MLTLLLRGFGDGAAPPAPPRRGIKVALDERPVFFQPGERRTRFVLGERGTFFEPDEPRARTR